MGVNSQMIGNRKLIEMEREKREQIYTSKDENHAKKVRVTNKLISWALANRQSFQMRTRMELASVLCAGLAQRPWLS